MVDVFSYFSVICDSNSDTPPCPVARSLQDPVRAASSGARVRRSADACTPKQELPPLQQLPARQVRRRDRQPVQVLRAILRQEWRRRQDRRLPDAECASEETQRHEDRRTDKVAPVPANDPPASLRPECWERQLCHERRLSSSEPLRTEGAPPESLMWQTNKARFRRRRRREANATDKGKRKWKRARGTTETRRRKRYIKSQTKGNKETSLSVGERVYRQQSKEGG